jgi:uncharacterized RDD family membrane protein YckC
MSQGFDGNLNPYAPPEQRFDQGFRPQHDDSVLLAPRGTRLGAILIDGLIGIGLGIPGAVVSGAMGLEGPGAVLSGLAGLALGIYQMYLLSTTGQTIGKRSLGIRIVKVDGSPVNFVSAVLLRAWVPILILLVPLLGFFIYLGGILMIFGDEQRTLSDRIAGTKVILAAYG